MLFAEVPWDEPLDVGHELAAIPRGAQIRGVFVIPLVAAARAARVPLAASRERCHAQQNYPLIEHATLLVEVARAVYPTLGMRRGLRKLGRGAVLAYLDSLVGRVTVGATDDPELMLDTVAKAYPLNIPGSSARVDRFGPGQAVLVLERVPYFLDCHHVGFIEQALRRCHVQPKIEVARIGENSAAYRCTWA